MYLSIEAMMLRQLRLNATTLSLVVLIVTSCINQVTTSGALNSTLRAKESCSVATPQLNIVPNLDIPLVGKFPIWFADKGSMLWSDLPVSLPPYSGRLAKDLLYVDDRIQGDIYLTGRQLDGSSAVLFPLGAKQVLDSKGNLLGSTLNGKPLSSLTISHTEAHEPKPQGFLNYGVLLFYPNPGCYELTASTTGYTVTIVVELQQ